MDYGFNYNLYYSSYNVKIEYILRIIKKIKKILLIYELIFTKR